MKLFLLISSLLFIVLVAGKEFELDELEEILSDKIENYEKALKQSFHMRKVTRHPRNAIYRDIYGFYDFRKLPSTFDQWGRSRFNKKTSVSEAAEGRRMVKVANTTAASKSTKIEVPDDDDDVQIMDLQFNGENADGNVVVTTALLKSLVNRISTLEKELKEVKTAVGLNPAGGSGTQGSEVPGSANTDKPGSSKVQEAKNPNANSAAVQKAEVMTPAKADEKRNENQATKQDASKSITTKTTANEKPDSKFVQKPKQEIQKKPVLSQQQNRNAMNLNQMNKRKIIGQRPSHSAAPMKRQRVAAVAPFISPRAQQPGIHAFNPQTVPQNSQMQFRVQQNMMQQIIRPVQPLMSLPPQPQALRMTRPPQQPFQQPPQQFNQHQQIWMRPRAPEPVQPGPNAFHSNFQHRMPMYGGHPNHSHPHQHSAWR